MDICTTCNKLNDTTNALYYMGKDTFSRDPLLLWDSYEGLLNKWEKMSYTIHYGGIVMGCTWSSRLRRAFVSLLASQRAMEDHMI